MEHFRMRTQLRHQFDMTVFDLLFMMAPLLSGVREIVRKQIIYDSYGDFQEEIEMHLRTCTDFDDEE
jgi:hypothetical protein